MLPKPHRLRHEKDIKTLFAKGKSVFGHGIGLKLAPNKREVSRFTVVVGTKVSKKAVERNQLKRRLRGILSEYYQEWRPGYDVIVLTKPVAGTMTRDQLHDELLRLVKRTPLVK